MQTIVDLIEQSCRNFSCKAALRHKVGEVWKEISYSAVWAASDRIFAGLIKNGFKAGDHAAILAPSSPRWVISYLGILKAGGIVIPIDKELKSLELSHVLEDCEAKVLFIERPYFDELHEMVNGLPFLRLIVTFNLEPLPHDFGTSGEIFSDAHFELPSETETQPAAVTEKYAGLEKPAGLSQQLRGLPPLRDISKEPARLFRLLTFEALSHEARISPVARRPSDIAVIIYTSGTTGLSKGAMLSHANIVSNIQSAISHLSLDESIHTLSILPISHVFEQICGVLLPLSLGGTVSFCESLKKIGENLAEEKPTFFLGVPALYRKLLDRIMKSIGSRMITRILFSLPLTRPLITARIRRTFGAGTVFISGGAALDPAIAKGLEKLGLTLFQGYGITETSPIISAECAGQTRLGSVGRVLPGIEVRIDSPNEEMVGEILVKGPNVMQGYYKNPQATLEVLVDGWYRTGDLGRFDADGFLAICGRVKNLIVTPNGKNVYPEEVENELLKSVYIAETVVYGQKVAPLTEEIHALIYPDLEALDDLARKQGKGSLSSAEVESLLKGEVLAACAGLATFKRVQKFTICGDEFPKTTTRKIKRFIVEKNILPGIAEPLRTNKEETTADLRQ
jgi:long-chain acyl-CoA synthetase